MAADTSDTSADIIGDLVAPYVLIAQAGRSIGGIIPNVTIQETIVDENTITQHPVQSGAPVSDHVFAMPVVTDMLVGWSDSTGGYPGYSIDIYNTILALRATRQPFDLYTGKRMISNVLFGTITQTTDETSEYALMLRVRLQEVIISDTAAAGGGTLPPQLQETDMGNQSLTPVTTPLPTTYGGGIGGLPVTPPSGGIGSA